MLNFTRFHEPLQVPLDGVSSLQHVDCLTEFGVVSELAEGALNPTVCVTDKRLNSITTDLQGHNFLLDAAFKYFSPSIKSFILKTFYLLSFYHLLSYLLRIKAKIPEADS